MKTKLTKRILAILCAITLLPIGTITTRAETQSNIKDQNSAIYEGMKELTLADAGIADISRSGLATASLGVDTLDGVLFSVRMKHSANFSQFHFGTQSDGAFNGIAIYKDGDMLMISNTGRGENALSNLEPHKFDATVAGVGDTFDNTEFILQIATKFVAKDSDGQKNDIELRLFFNGKLYNNEVIYIKDQADRLGTCINVNNVAIDTLASYYQAKDVTVPSDMKERTLADAGIADITSKAALATTSLGVDTLDGVLFSVRMKHSTNFAQFHFGTQADKALNGIAIYKDGDMLMISNTGKGENDLSNLKPRKFNATVAGVGDTFDNIEFILQIATKFVAKDSDGQKNDIELRLFFNGKLYNNEVIYIKDQADRLGTCINVNNAAIDTLASYYQAKDATVPSDMKERTLMDAGVANVTNSAFANAALNTSSLDGVLFSVRMKHSANFAQFHFGTQYNEGFNGIAIYKDGDMLMISNTGRGENALSNLKPRRFNATVAGVGDTFDNTEFILQIATKFVAKDSDGQKNDIELRLFFNGKLYNNEVIYIKDQADRLGTYINVNNVAIATLASYYNVKDVSVPTDMKELTLTDAWMTDVHNSTFGNIPFNISSLDGVLFSAKMKHSANFAQFHFGTQENEGFNGIAIYKDGDMLMISNTGRGENALTNLKPRRFNATVAGVGDTFHDTEFLLQIAVRFVDRDGDGQRNDIELRFFFNGKLYNDELIYINDQADRLGNYINVNNATIDFLGVYCKEETGTVDLPLNFQRLTTSDAEIADRNTYVKRGDFGVDSLDETLFSAKVKFGTNFSRIHLGTVESVSPYTGISFRLEENKMVVGNDRAAAGDTGKGFMSNMLFRLLTVDPVAAGVGSTFVDTEFLLQVSIEFVDYEGDGQENDIKLGVYINGALYNNQYLYIRDNAPDLGTEMNYGDGTIVLTSYDYQNKFTELTEKDFGLDNLTVSNKTHTAKLSDDSLAATAITTMLQFPKNEGNSLYIGGVDKGLCLTTAKEGTLQVSFVDEAKKKTVLLTMDAKEVGVSSFSEASHKWRFTFRINESATENRVLVGIYVDGELYNKELIILKNVNTDCFKRVIGVHSLNGSMKFDHYEYEEYTLIDFNMKDRDVTEKDQTPYFGFNFRNKDTLDGVAFTALVKYANGTSYFAMGALSNGWDGIVFNAQNKDRIEVVEVHRNAENKSKTTVLGFITSDEVGHELTGTEMKMRITYDLDTTINGEKTMRIGIHINDKYYDTFIMRYADTKPIYRTIRLYVAETPFYIHSAWQKKPDLSIYGY